MDHSFPIRLICPSCRVPGPPGQRVEHVLVQGPDTDECPGCGATYGRDHGIRKVLPHPVDDTSTTDDPTDPGFQEAVLTGIYAIAHYPDVSPTPEWIAAVQENARARDVLLGWLDRHPVSDSARAPVALEVGCGPGRFTAELAGRFSQGAVGLDIRLSMLRLARHLTAGENVTVPFRAEGSRFEDVRIESSGPSPGPVHLIQADAIAPPFEAEIFPLVAGLSVLDSMDDPVIFLGQIDALIAPGGLLLLAQPWQWEPTVTPPHAWWSGPSGTGPEVLRAALSGRSAQLPHLSYEVLEETDGLPWNLPGHRRLLYRYSLHAVLARKQKAAS